MAASRRKDVRDDDDDDEEEEEEPAPAPAPKRRRRSVDAVTMRPCLALLLVTAVRAGRHGDVMRPWSPPRPPRQSAVCARPPRPKNCVRLRHGWARRPPRRRAGRPPLAALAAAANATDRYNDDCRTCFLGNGTQLYEPKYRNFPLRWSSKVGVWKLTEADIEAQVQLMRQTEGNKGARNTRGALTGCREELCCAEKESDCYDDKIAPDTPPIVALYSTAPFVNMTKNLLLQLKRADWQNIHLVELLALDETTAAAFSSFPNINVRRSHAVENIPTAPNFGTKAFRQITIHKARFLAQLLDAAAAETRPILFMDSDIVILKSLIPFLESYKPSADILIQTNEKNANTGFIFIRPTRRAAKLIRAWDDEYHNRLQNKHHKWTGMSDQAVFNDLPRSDVQVAYLPSRRFPTGRTYFTNLSPISPVLQRPNDDSRFMFHNNGIIGLENKIQRLQSLNLWHPLGFDESFRNNRPVEVPEEKKV